MADRGPDLNAEQRRTVEKYLARAADPASLEAGLSRLIEAGADPRPRLEGWLKLIDASPACVETLVQRPALVADIPNGGREIDLAEALRRIPSSKERVDYLRTVRIDETLRIAWMDVVEQADLTIVTQRISCLAERIVESLLLEIAGRLAGRYGRPWAGGAPVGLSVIAMGKLGGAELNYSSDIDLIFLYGKDGRTDGGEKGRSISNREFFHRVVEQFMREAGAVTSRGRLYRVDLRLRPEGATGSLVRSIASSMSYYLRMGETWERQALLKARVIAGDRTTGEQFVTSVNDWAYGRGLSFREIAALKRIKQRVEELTVHRGEERSEIKLGYGGIRDVESVIQFLQLMHGARLPEVRHHNSLSALRLLEAAHAITPGERDALDHAYRFLRLVEHRLQLVRGTQVHRIPSDPQAQTALARRCGFPDREAFHEAHRQRAEAVRGVFDRLFRRLFKQRNSVQMHETDLVLQPDAAPGELAAVLEAHGVRDSTAGVKTVALLCRETTPLLAGSPRTRKFLADLFPRLLDAIAQTPDPDAALRRLERITARVGARATLYGALSEDERLLRLLVDLAGNSAFLCHILERTPGALDQLVDALATEPGRGLASFEDIPTATVPTAANPARILADYRNLEMLRIGLRDVRGERNVAGVGADLTRLAEVILRLAHERARREAGRRATDLVVVALGKFGGGELLYGSDLDLVFFAPGGPELERATTLARRISALIGSPSPHGRLYEVDHRLRPGGSSGPLVATPAQLHDYFARGIGQTWERMAYTRARAVAGPPGLSDEIEAAIEAAIYPPGFGAEDARAIAEMREKVAAAGGPASLKRGRRGGVLDVEFVAQIVALRRGGEEPGFRKGNVTKLLDCLEETSAAEARLAADLRLAYSFLMALQSKLRIVADLSEDRLPEDPGALDALARRLGYLSTRLMPAAEALREEYEYHRTIAARALEQVLAP